MANKQQAPILGARGEKFQGEKMKAIMGWRLKEFIYNNLGERDFAMWKVMDYCITNASETECAAKGKEPFRLAEEGIFNRVNISKNGYLNARKKLEVKGWLEVKNGHVYVLYDELYRQVIAWEKAKSTTEITPSGTEKSMGTTENYPLGTTENYPMSTTEWSHNNITEQDKDTIILEDACAKGGEQKQEEKKKEPVIVGTIDRSSLSLLFPENYKIIDDYHVHLINIPKSGIYEIKNPQR